MFLDDKAVKVCEDRIIVTGKDLQDLYSEICLMFDNYIKKNLDPENNPAGMTYKHATFVFDRTFNLWDSMIRQLKKSNDGRLNVLADLFEKYSFKDRVLSDNEMLRIYREGGGKFNQNKNQKRHG